MKVMKYIGIGLIFAFVVVCWETNWIETILSLDYSVAPGWCSSMLLALITSILILKK